MNFKAILNDLITSIPSASGAILADWEGEAVDQSCLYDDFELKVIGAYKGIILQQMKDVYSRFPVGDLQEAVITTEAQRIILGAVGPDYLLVMTLAREAIVGLALYEFRKTVKILEKEIY